MLEIILIIISYLIGSIPTGYIFTVKLAGIDVRNVGSGNVGATNAARALGIKFGAIVALLDLLKGFVAVSIIIAIAETGSYMPYLAGLGAILGHDHSIFLKFSGGKGVATTFGVLLRLNPTVFLIIAVIWLILTILTKYVSVASLIAAMLMPVGAYIFINQQIAVTYFFLYGLLIIIKHHANIKRLFRGEENRFSGSSD